MRKIHVTKTIIFKNIFQIFGKHNQTSFRLGPCESEIYRSSRIKSQIKSNARVKSTFNFYFFINLQCTCNSLAQIMMRLTYLFNILSLNLIGPKGPTCT